jgi:hypothetical protein
MSYPNRGGRFTPRQASIRAAVASYVGGFFERVVYRVEQHSERLDFTLFVTMAVLRNLIAAEEVGVLRTMTEDPSLTMSRRRVPDRKSGLDLIFQIEQQNGFAFPLAWAPAGRLEMSR